MLLLAPRVFLASSRTSLSSRDAIDMLSFNLPIYKRLVNNSKIGSPMSSKIKISLRNHFNRRLTAGYASISAGLRPPRNAMGIEHERKTFDMISIQDEA